MECTAQKEGTKVIIIPKGRIDSVTAPEFAKHIDENINGCNELVLDFNQLDYISSAGLRVLLTNHKNMVKNKGTMTVINVNEVIMDVLNITGFVDILTISK